MFNYKLWDRIDTDVESGLQGLQEHGIACLRGFAQGGALTALVAKTNEMLSKPSVYGSRGYYKKIVIKNCLKPFS